MMLNQGTIRQSDFSLSLCLEPLPAALGIGSVPSRADVQSCRSFIPGSTSFFTSTFELQVLSNKKVDQKYFVYLDSDVDEKNLNKKRHELNTGHQSELDRFQIRNEKIDRPGFEPLKK